MGILIADCSCDFIDCDESEYVEIDGEVYCLEHAELSEWGACAYDSGVREFTRECIPWGGPEGQGDI